MAKRAPAVLGIVVLAGLLALAGTRAAFSAETGGVVWEESYTNGMATAKREQRPALIFFSSDSCGWCRLMEKDVFSDAGVARAVTNHVCIRVKVERDPQTAALYGVESMPRIVVVSREARIAGDQLGYVPADRFLQFLKTAADGGAAEAPPVPQPPGPDLAGLAQAASEVRDGDRFPEEFLRFLADPDPRVREEAARVVRGKGRGSVPSLVQALSSDYLGARIMACRLLGELAGDEPAYDPWAPKAARAKAAAQWADRVRRGPGAP